MAHLLSWLEHIGVIAVFALVLVEQCGLPIPSYPLLIVAGSWSMQGGSSPVRIVAAAVIACLLADLGWYAAGRRYGSRVLKMMCRLSLEPDSCVASTEKLFLRMGTRGLLIAKFVPGLGAVSTAMSGVNRASLAEFTAYDVIGSILWSVSAVAIGAFFHDAVADVFDALENLGHIGIWLMIGVIGAYLAFKFWRRHEFFRELRMGRISVVELLHLIDAGPRPTIIDARPRASQARDGMIPGAIDFELIDAYLAGTPPDAEVIVYCACPNEATAARVAKQVIAKGFRRVRPLDGGIHAWQKAGFAVVKPVT